MNSSRCFPIGAEPVQGGVQFRVWAPLAKTVSVLWYEKSHPTDEIRHLLNAENSGYFVGMVPQMNVGDLYWLQLDDAGECYPDPASRYQPDGHTGRSCVVDPASFRWTDDQWPGLTDRGNVLYEMHIGTFTPEGTWQAAAQQLEELANCGINVIELMPIAEFPGNFGWGYDGVNLFAPTRLYGTPDDARAFIDKAHAVGIGVILDVVYNHIGPDGNYLPRFSDSYFSRTHTTDWGAAINFDDEGSGPVREFFETNAAYWITEFHFDGLRFDATQDIKDESDDNIMAAITRTARRVAGNRSLYIIGENEPQRIQLAETADVGGYGMDALWNDDFHHAANVLMSGHSEAYYTDYQGRAQEFISSFKYGFLYQGQFYRWQGKRRGSPGLRQPATRYVHFLQNHDQIANSAGGVRCHELTSAGRFKAMTVLLLLSPQTPLLFQGQEFGSRSPFFYFADHRGELARMVHEGRRTFMAQFRSVASPEIQAQLPNPADPTTFVRSKLHFDERRTNGPVYQLHRDLIRLRREDPVFNRRTPAQLDGAVITEETFVLRYIASDNDDRLIVINFGRDLRFDPAPEPLLAPPPGCNYWEKMLSTEDTLYGGWGTAPVDTEDNWRIPGHAAIVLRGAFLEPAKPATVAAKK